MPRYFFDVEDSRGRHPDAFGDDFDSFEEAERMCWRLLPDIARTDLHRDGCLVVRCDMRDERGRVVYRGEIAYRET